MNRRTALAVALALFALAAPGCTSPGDDSPDSGRPVAERPAPTGIAPEALMAAGEEHGIHNLGEVAPGLFRGAQPEGEESFRYLASLGVRTILTVDGATPDAEGAAKHGIRYIHVPIEYAGITDDEKARIARVAQLHGNDGLYVHCHHGKHRGPAAMGVVWMTRDGVSSDEVVADMKKAGTDPKYRGLYAVAQSFVCPSQDVLDAIPDSALTAAAPVQGIIEAMVAIDASFVRMKNAKKAGWKVSADHPDVNPPHEARILAERFRELARTDEAQSHSADFKGWLAASEEAAWAMEKAIEAGDGAAAAKSLEVINKSCNSCHDVYRNNW